jgi:hypothetical protein
VKLTIEIPSHANAINARASHVSQLAGNIGTNMKQINLVFNGSVEKWHLTVKHGEIRGKTFFVDHVEEAMFESYQDALTALQNFAKNRN